MVRTLHRYLAWDLARITALALGAFTLVMTVFAVMEPLRKQGLSTQQMISLFGFTLPTMVSLTLPVAALFATTIVYGRFSQENELLAANASGVSTLRLLRPALTLGLLVSLATLGLSNFVAPRMAAMAHMAVEFNIKDIFYHKLRTDGYLDYGGFVIHAQHADPEQNFLQGVVAANARKGDDAELLSAASARVYFQSDEQNDYSARVDLADAVVVTPGQRHAKESAVVQHSRLPLPPLPLPPTLEEDPKWLEWRQLLQMLEHPEQDRKLQQRVKTLLRKFSHHLVLQEVKAAVDAGETYDALQDEEFVYLVRAGHAAFHDGHAPDRRRLDVRTFLRLSSTERQRVEVEVRKDGRTVRTVRADTADLQPDLSAGPIPTSYNDPEKVKSRVTLKLEGNVTIEEGGSAPLAARTHRVAEWVAGTPLVPPDLVERTMAMQESVLTPGRQTPEWLRRESEGIRKKLKELRGDLLAELHVRGAYGVSCFLMVALGAALGVLFRGGQMITAFALSVVPAMVVIVMLVMGKQIVRNPELPAALGVLAIWGGIIVLALANLFLYGRLVRR